jgi:hypothetical protein
LPPAVLSPQKYAQIFIREGHTHESVIEVLMHRCGISHDEAVRITAAEFARQQWQDEEALDSEHNINPQED